MASDKKKQLLFGGMGVLALVVLAVLLIRSGASDGASQTRQPNEPVVRDTDSDFDDEPASVATRSTPTVGGSRDGRLTGGSDGSAVDEDEDQSSVAKKSKRQKKRRSRKKKSGDESDDEEEIKKSGQEKVIPRPF